MGIKLANEWRERAAHIIVIYGRDMMWSLVHTICGVIINGWKITLGKSKSMYYFGFNFVNQITQVINVYFWICYIHLIKYMFLFLNIKVSINTEYYGHPLCKRNICFISVSRLSEHIWTLLLHLHLIRPTQHIYIYIFWLCLFVSLFKCVSN